MRHAKYAERGGGGGGGGGGLGGGRGLELGTALGYNMCHSLVRKLYSTVSKSTTIPGRKIGLLMFVFHSRSVCNRVRERADDVCHAILYKAIVSAPGIIY